ncbi:hypothetical protein J4732_13585 [Serratia marcescens]|uniref:Uncharacterized protein n=1 Tax=Serratia marcescens TaxID=615 RepID=A0A939SNT2_SERMA|nr:hypothetical protein [Serratia marcescens]
MARDQQLARQRMELTVLRGNCRAAGGESDATVATLPRFVNAAAVDRRAGRRTARSPDAQRAERCCGERCRKPPKPKRRRCRPNGASPSWSPLRRHRHRRLHNASASTERSCTLCVPRWGE